MLNFDVLILGSGLAGQSLALRLAAQRRVALVTKKMLEDSASGWAQGGIAAVLDAADSNEAHIQDTLTAGAGLCDVEVTRFVVEHGRSAIEWLINQGVHFTRDVSTPLGYHLTREGGHSHRRVFHVADAPAPRYRKLTDKIRRHPNIAVFERHIAVDLITAQTRRPVGCVGAYVLDIEETGADFQPHGTGHRAPQSIFTPLTRHRYRRRHAMAWRAGCRYRIWDSCNSTRLASTILPSRFDFRAVRGEGGLLRLPEHRFMPNATHVPNWRRATS